MMRALVAPLMLLAALILFASSARADDTVSARQKFSEATAAHARGDYAQAARLFEEAHRLAPAAGAKFNAGVAWDRASEPARAADAYETALDMGGLEHDEAEQAQSRLSALKKTLGYLRIDEPLGALVSIPDVVERAPVPVRLHVRPGTYEIRAEVSGSVVSERVTVGADETKSIAIERPRNAARPDTARPTKPTRPENVLPPDRPTQRPSSAQRTWGWVAIGAGALAAGAAVFLGFKFLDANDEFDKDRRNIDNHDRAVTLRTATNVAWGGAALLGGTGVVLLLTSPKVEF